MKINKNLYIIIAIVAAVALMFWLWSSKQASIKAPSDVSDINQDLEGLDINDQDSEFKQIDKELDVLQ